MPVKQASQSLHLRSSLKKHKAAFSKENLTNVMTSKNASSESLDLAGVKIYNPLASCDRRNERDEYRTAQADDMVILDSIE